jgi:hypothetical protein
LNGIFTVQRCLGFCRFSRQLSGAPVLTSAASVVLSELSAEISH